MGALFTQSHAISLCMLMTSAQTEGAMCDLELVCDGQTIRVHKLVVCLQSLVIRAACTGLFMEATGRYEMKDCEFASVRRMVDFLYKGDYDAKLSDKTESSEEMFVHVAMFTLADKYIIDGLRTLSQIKFKAAVTKQEKPSVMPQYVKLVYDLEFESSKTLRDVVVEAVRLRVAALPSNLDVRKILDTLMDDFPEFAKDLAMSYIEKPQYTTGPIAVVSGKNNANPIRNGPKISWVS